jgi:hypothetical protein
MNHYFKCSYGDPNGNHISVQTRGRLPNSYEHSYSQQCTVPSAVLNNGKIHTVKMVRKFSKGEFYHFLEVKRENILWVFLNQKLVLSCPLSASFSFEDCWFGFTGATGGLYESHQILSWRLWSK